MAGRDSSDGGPRRATSRDSPATRPALPHDGAGESREAPAERGTPTMTGAALPETRIAGPPGGAGELESFWKFG